jgi:hypothetical protein
MFSTNYDHLLYERLLAEAAKRELALAIISTGDSALEALILSVRGSLLELIELVRRGGRVHGHF